MQKGENGSPRPIQVAVAVLHCGAGCTLGDAIAENAVPALGPTFAGMFGSRLIIDFILAFALGIVFQYLTIAPMRNLPFGEGIIAAIKADTISISMFELGMFGWMALVYFVLFPSPHLHPDEAVFWFMMQIAMIIGWATSYPANMWLIKKGWKEKMPEFAERNKATNTAGRCLKDEARAYALECPVRPGKVAIYSTRPEQCILLVTGPNVLFPGIVAIDKLLVNRLRGRAVRLTSQRLILSPGRFFAL